MPQGEHRQAAVGHQLAHVGRPPGIGSGTDPRRARIHGAATAEASRGGGGINSTCVRGRDISRPPCQDHNPPACLPTALPRDATCRRSQRMSTATCLHASARHGPDHGGRCTLRRITRHTSCRTTSEGRGPRTPSATLTGHEKARCARDMSEAAAPGCLSGIDGSSAGWPVSALPRPCGLRLYARTCVAPRLPLRDSSSIPSTQCWGPSLVTPAPHAAIPPPELLEPWVFFGRPGGRGERS